MAEHYYSTKSVLNWVIAHYFYGATHYTWLANCFYPYGQGNPKSSNPLLNYQDLYQPWKDADPFDKFIASSRINLIKGIMRKEKDGALSAAQGAALRDICDKISTLFFYPIVFRVDLDRIAADRRIVANSGLRGSSEYLVQDLQESEFDILFLDFSADADFAALAAGIMGSGGYIDSYQVMDILERRKNVGT
jgi:hypothetical protein